MAASRSKSVSKKLLKAEDDNPVRLRERIVELERQLLDKQTSFGEQIEQILEACPIGVTIQDFDGNRLFVNEAQLKNFGARSKEELLSVNYNNSLVNPEDGVQLDVRISGIVKFTDAEFHRKRLDNSKWWCLLNRNTIQYKGQEVYIAWLQDITNRKDSDRLREEARKQADKANHSKSEFLASMSHELRTPMNAVLGFAQMLQFDPKNPLSTIQNEHVENILTGGHHLLELINEVLDLSKIEAQELSLNVETIAANEVVADCVRLTLPVGQHRGVSINNTFGDGPTVFIRADQMRFKQALINILGNAVKYNKDSGTVTVKGLETDDGFLRICVTDTGVGIAEVEHDSVFELFHRVGLGAMTSREGTGIGLTVSKLLVEKMSGRIGFESEEDVGSEFWIEMPLATNINTLD